MNLKLTGAVQNKCCINRESASAVNEGDTSDRFRWPDV